MIFSLVVTIRPITKREISDIGLDTLAHDEVIYFLLSNNDFQRQLSRLKESTELRNLFQEPMSIGSCMCNLRFH